MLIFAFSRTFLLFHDIVILAYLKHTFFISVIIFIMELLELGDRQMFSHIITNLILLIAFSIIIFWPFFNNDKMYKLVKEQSPIFSILIGFFFAAMAIAFHYLSPGLENGIYANSRLLLILYSGLIGGPLAVLTSSSLIICTRDLLGSVTDITAIMKWHTLFTGLMIAAVSFKIPITLKNMHYYYGVILAQFSVVIFVCHLIYDIPLLELVNFIVYMCIAYICIYFLLKKFNDLSIQLFAMRQLHRKDYLTNMPNNLASEEYLQTLLNRRVPFELLHIDIDSFKNFNAEHTYRVGDEMLRQISTVLNTISNNKRAFVGRIGGDEFCFILTNSNPASAVHVAYEINQTIENTTFHYNNQTYSLGVSICACSYPQNGRTLEELYFETINGLKAITSVQLNNVAHVNQLRHEGKLH